MLTVYEDQLRFDIAVDSCSHLADVEETDDCMSCVRIDRALINSVDISDCAPIPRLPSQSVFNALDTSFSISNPVAITVIIYEKVGFL